MKTPSKIKETPVVKEVKPKVIGEENIEINDGVMSNNIEPKVIEGANTLASIDGVNDSTPPKEVEPISAITEINDSIMNDIASYFIKLPLNGTVKKTDMPIIIVYCCVDDRNKIRSVIDTAKRVERFNKKCNPPINEKDLRIIIDNTRISVLEYLNKMKNMERENKERERRREKEDREAWDRNQKNKERGSKKNNTDERVSFGIEKGFIEFGERGGLLYNHEKIADHLSGKLNTISWNSRCGYWDGEKYVVNNVIEKINEEIHTLANMIGYVGNIDSLERGVRKRIILLNRYDTNPTDLIKSRLFFKNGMVNVSDDYKISLSKHEPKNLNNYVLNANYNENANVVAARAWLDQYGGAGDQFISIVASVFAKKFLYDEELFKVIFYILGQKDTAKTYLFTNLLSREILGVENCSYLSLHEMKDKFGLSNMVGKIANISDDTEGRPAEFASILKGITGGSGRYTEEKYMSKEFNKIWPILLYTGNKLPMFADIELETGPAFWDRWSVIELTERFKPAGFTGELPDGWKIIVPYNDEIIDGVVKMAVDRSVLFLKDRSISGFDISFVDKIKLYNDNFERFFYDRIESREGNYVTFTEMKEEYDKYVLDYNIHRRDTLRPQRLKDRLVNEKKVKYEEGRIISSRNRVRRYMDISIKSHENPHKYQENDIEFDVGVVSEIKEQKISSG